MTHFVLLPGAGGDGWFWHRVVPLLEDAGHTAVALDLPADDPGSGLPEYVELALAACAYEEDVVLVGQSLGGFTAVMAADRLIAAHRPPRELVLLNAMVPSPGETPGAWWGNVDSESARVAAAEAGGWPTEIDLENYFLHDVPADVFEGAPPPKDEVDAVFASVCEVAAWPDVPTRVLAGADDRFFPLDLQQRVARKRLGVEPTVVPGGHLAALSHPSQVTRAILTP